MQLKAAKFAALFARLRSAFPLLALLALFVALPRTASAATFPARSGDMPDTLITEDSPTVPYYTDGSTKYAFTTWDNLLRAVGINPESGDSIISGRTIVGGTGASDMLNVTVYNLKQKPSVFCGGVRVKTLGKQDSCNALLEERDQIQYTRFNFVDCVFEQDGGGFWGMGIANQIGIQVSFVRCHFGEDGNNGEGLRTKTFIVRSSGDEKYGIDVFVDHCEIWPGTGYGNRFLFADTSTETGLYGCGDVQITDSQAGGFVMPISKGKDAFGGDAELLVECLQIAQRLKKIGWASCFANKGFATATYRNFKYHDGSDYKFFAYHSLGANDPDESYPQGQGEFLGTDLHSEFTWHKGDDESKTFYFMAVPVCVTYNGNDNTSGNAPAPCEGVSNLRFVGSTLTEDVTLPSGGSLKKGSQVVTSWNTKADGSGTKYDIGTTQIGVSSVLTLYAQYGTPVPQYSVDGGVTWNDYPTEGKWQAVIDAYRNHCKSGASATEELVGGTSEKQGTILVRNVVFDAYDQLHSDSRLAGWQYCICSYRDHLQYTTIRFDNCTFDKMSTDHGCFGPGAMGQQMEFVNCDFYSDISSSKYAENALYSGVIVPGGADLNSYYPIDISLDNCRALVFNGGGPCIGDLSVVNCSFRLNVNGHIDGGPFGVNSFGLPSTCHIENLQPQPGADFKGETPADNKLFSSWTCSFARYEVSGSEGYITTAYRSWRHEIPNSGGKNYPRDIRGEVPGDKDKLNVLNSVSDSVVIEPQNETEARWPSDKRGVGHGVFLEYSLAGPTPPTTPHDFFVKPASEGGLAANSGADWDHATTLLSAIAKAADADQPVTIYVKEGTYSEGSGSEVIASIGSSHTQPITILGGCTGVGTAQGTGYSLYQASSRNSTDQRPKWLKRSSDSTCALTISRVKVKLYDQGASVEGSGNFTMTDCHFIRNGDHGALCAKTTGQVTLQRCEFRGNLIAGKLNTNIDTTVWDDRYFAPVVIEANATIEHCAFVANVACSLYTWNCGGLGVGGTGTTVSIDFCTFAYNICAKIVNKVAQDSCCVAGLSLGGSASVTVDNSIFVNPERTDGEPDARFICGCADEAGALLYTGHLTLGYVLIPSGVDEVGPTGKEWQKGIWKIAQNQVTWNSAKVTIGEAQLVDKTSFWSKGNPVYLGMDVGDNARFRVSCLDAETIDIHPLSAGGHYQAGGEWVADYITSPAVDRGDPAVAYSNEPSPNGGRVNLGYYGNTAEASKTPSVTFDQKGGTGGAEPVSPTVGATMPTISGTPTLANHRFAGYSREGWEVVTMTGRDTDIYNIGTLTYAYCPTAVSGGIKLNGVKFESLLAAQVTAFGQIEVSATTRSSDGWPADVGKSGDYKNLMGYKLLVENVDQITVTLKGLEKDHSYLMQLVCHDGTSGYNAGFKIDGVDYECNSQKLPDIQYGRSFVLRFKATGSSYSFPLKKIGTFIHINAIQVRDITSLGSLQYYDGTGASVREYPVVDRPAKLYAQWVSHEFFVKPTGQGGAASNSGANWENATTLSSAVARAANAPEPVTIYVHEGTYKEGAGSSEVIASIGSSHTQPITILGGCTGTTGTDKSRGTGHSVYQPTDVSIVTTSRPTWLRREDGANCSLAISQVDVREYSTGAYVVGSGDFALTNCNFIQNGDIGALYAKPTNGKTSLYGCEFRGNLKVKDGWDVYRCPVTVIGNSEINHCAFVGNGNHSDDLVFGGGLGVGGTDASQTIDISFCTIAYNNAKQNDSFGLSQHQLVLGGAADVSVRNSLFANTRYNDSYKNEAIKSHGDFTGTLKLSHVLFPGSVSSSVASISKVESTGVVVASGQDVHLVSDPTLKAGDADLRPKVNSWNYYYVHTVPAESIDIHLKSEAGHWNGSGWTPDGVTSPAIDAGDPDEAYSNEPMPNGGCVNLGYYGNTAQASKSPYARVRLNANGGTPDPDPATVTVTAGQAMPHLVEGQTNITRSGYAFLGYGRAGWEVKSMTGNMTDFINEGESKWAYMAWHSLSVVPIILNGTEFTTGMNKQRTEFGVEDGQPSFTSDLYFDDFSDRYIEDDFLGRESVYINVVRSRIEVQDYSNISSLTFTLRRGLVVGRAYAVQIISYQNNESSASQRLGFSPESYYGTGAPENPKGISLVYRFVATNTAQDVTLYKPKADWFRISAVQLRELGDASVLDMYYDANGNSLKSYPAENGPTELYAQWERQMVLLDDNGGSEGDGSVPLTDGVPEASSVTRPFRNGWSFRGYWTSKDDDTGTMIYDQTGALVDNPPSLASGSTLYAHWVFVETYYLAGTDQPKDTLPKTCSFYCTPTNENGTLKSPKKGWAETQEGESVRHIVEPGHKYVAHTFLYTPYVSDGSVQEFPGDELYLSSWLELYSDVRFKKLITGGLKTVFCVDANNCDVTVSGAVEMESGNTLEMIVCGENRRLELAATLTGDETTVIKLLGQNQKNDSNLGYVFSGDASGFKGRIKDGIGVNPGCVYHCMFDVSFTGSFGGSVESFPTNVANAWFNYDGLPDTRTTRGLTMSCEAPADVASVTNNIILYSDSPSVDFDASNFPLMTFPAGTEVDPAQFTVCHATEVGGEKTAFKDLYAIRNADETITLIANAQIVTLDDNGGAEGDGAVLLDNGVPPASVSRPFYNGYSFRGYWTTKDDDTGAMIYDQTGALVANPPTLHNGDTIYAHWEFVEIYYLAGPDQGADPSFDGTPLGTGGSVTINNGWAEKPNGPAVRHTVEPGHKYTTKNDGKGYSLFTPSNQDGEVHSFLGDELTVTGTFALQESINVTNMIANGASIYTWKNGYHYIVDGQITVTNNSTLQLTGVGTDRTLEIRAKVKSGDGEIIALHGQPNADQRNLRFIISGDMSEFKGTWTKSSTEIAVPTTIDFSGSFGGRIKCFPTNMVNVLVNHDGLPKSCEATGLPVTAAASADDVRSVQTNVTFYSKEVDFTARFFPLMTFPASVAVDPAQFTVYHAADTNGTKTAFANLGVRTNGDGTITLVANSVLSAIRENGPEIHFWNLDWIAEVCSTGTTAADYQAAFLKTNAQGVVTWQAYVLGYEPDEVATAAILEESVQNANPETVTIRLVDLPTNPRTNDMVGVRYALLAARSTGDFAAGNAKVVVNLDDDPYEFWPVSTFEAPLRDLTDEEPVNYYQIKVRFFFNRPIYDNEVEWLRIESQDDDDYIDTGIKITHDMRFETKVMLETSRQSYSRFGFDDSIVKGQSVVGDEHGFTRIMFSVAQDTACFGFQSSGNVISAGFVSVDEVKNTELVIAGDYDQYTVNNKTYDTYSTHIDDDPGVGTMKLMAFGNGRFSSEKFAGKMWYFRIYKGDELIADFVPVKITTDDGGVEYAMYDKVGGRLHRNHGTGSFTGGPAVQ